MTIDNAKGLLLQRGFCPQFDRTLSGALYLIFETASGKFSLPVIGGFEAPRVNGDVLVSLLSTEQPGPNFSL